MRLTLFAIRNLGRNKRRSASMLAMIALATMALVLAGGYAAANFRGLRDQTIRNGVGHLQIGEPGFRDHEDRPLSRGLEDVESVRRIVSADPRVRATAPRVEFTGLASTNDRSVAVLGRAVLPSGEYRDAGFAPRMLHGRRVAEGAEHEAMAAAGLASTLNLRIGDRLTILAATVDGAINGLDTVIVGIYTTGVRELDARSMVVRVDTAHTLLNTTRVSKLVVVLGRTADTAAAQDALASALRAAGRDVEILTWSDLAPFYHQVRGLFSGIFGFLGIIITALVVLSAANAMTMAVMERVREIGTLMALGTSRARVMGMFVAEGLTLGVLGGTTGLVLGWACAVGLSRAGIIMPPPPTFTTGFPLEIDVVAPLYLLVLLLMVATLGIAAVLPAARAARLRITDALGHV
ncbi:MAG: ABC transporter permease [Acidobacteria bacterium]|nr:ABC transporter permease [Acidobacteriota bacterium]